MGRVERSFGDNLDEGRLCEIEGGEESGCIFRVVDCGATRAGLDHDALRVSGSPLLGAFRQYPTRRGIADRHARAADPGPDDLRVMRGDSDHHLGGYCLTVNGLWKCASDGHQPNARECHSCKHSSLQPCLEDDSCCSVARER